MVGKIETFLNSGRSMARSSGNGGEQRAMLPWKRDQKLLPWKREQAPAPSLAPARSTDLVRGDVLARPESRAQLFAGLRLAHSRIISDLPEDGHTVIAVCSALPGEGKTTVAVALAEMLSEDFSRQTLLIDGDLQRPQLHDLFDVDPSMGVKECLNSGALLPGAIRWSNGLWVMPAGSSASTPDSLDLDNQRNLVRAVRGLFRMTVIDLPAVLNRPQGVLLSLLANNVLWVVRADASPVDVVGSAMDMVGRDRILGVVLNGEHSQVPAWLSRLL